jgi:hypothetical protein
MPGATGTAPGVKSDLVGVQLSCSSRTPLPLSRAPYPMAPSADDAIGCDAPDDACGSAWLPRLLRVAGVGCAGVVGDGWEPPALTCAAAVQLALSGEGEIGACPFLPSGEELRLVLPRRRTCRVRTFVAVERTPAAADAESAVGRPPPPPKGVLLAVELCVASHPSPAAAQGWLPSPAGLSCAWCRTPAATASAPLCPSVHARGSSEAIGVASGADPLQAIGWVSATGAAVDRTAVSDGSCTPARWPSPPFVMFPPAAACEAGTVPVTGVTLPTANEPAAVEYGLCTLGDCPRARTGATALCAAATMVSGDGVWPATTTGFEDAGAATIAASGEGACPATMASGVGACEGTE